MLDTHVIRLGTHAEKDYLLKAYAWFDEVVLNANLVEGTSASLAIFLNELRGKGKRYFIDPMTYAFALSPNLLMRQQGIQANRGYLKRTFDGLAKRYGGVVHQHAGERALEPTHFNSEADQAELCQNVLNYQKDRLNEAIRVSQDFLVTEVEPLQPAKLVAPYFHLSSNMEWLELNIAFASKACQIEPETWVVVCLDFLLLDSTRPLEDIVEKYKALPTQGYLLWITNFDEDRATEGQIQGLRRVLSKLSQGGTKSVVNMFGGYFSCLLAKDGLTGISHGLGYGERRNIEPVLGGGLPPAKYYLPPIHQHIRMDQFVTIARGLDDSSFRRRICNCVVCQGLLTQGIDFLTQQYTNSTTKIVNGRYRQVATPQVYRLTRFHYLSNKNLEFRRCGEYTQAEILEELNSAYQQFRHELGTSFLMYLQTWGRALFSQL